MEENSVFMTVLMIAGIGVIVMVCLFAAASIMSQSDTAEVETFTVPTISNDYDCNLRRTITGSPVVEFYDGESWQTLTETTDYTYEGMVVTVYSSAMT